VFCQEDGARLVPLQDTSDDPYIGVELLNQFRIERLLGEGGMGRVYRAEQPSLGRYVAVKILHRELAETNPDAVRRFRREARVTTSLEHPNVVKVMLSGDMPDGSPYMVMEFIDGQPLQDFMAAQPSLSLQTALHIGIQIAEGVGKAHESGIVHRDVKPENVIITSRDGDSHFVKVLDFGIARLLWDQETVQTKSGLVFGTALYISPEGATGEPTDARSDVYSIAVVLYQLLAGRPPFPGSIVIDLLMAHVNEKPTPIRTLVPTLPKPISSVIMKALDKSPSKRPATASDFAAELREACFEVGLALEAGPPRGLARTTRDSVSRVEVERASGQPTSFEGPAKLQAASSLDIPTRGRGVARAFAITALMVGAFIAGAAALLVGAYLAGAFRVAERGAVESGGASEAPPGVEPTSPHRVDPIPSAPSFLAAVLPAEPRVSERVQLFGVASGLETEPVFRIRRQGDSQAQSVTASRDGDGNWRASFRFRRPGRYAVSLAARDSEAELASTSVTIASRGTSARARSRERVRMPARVASDTGRQINRRVEALRTNWAGDDTTRRPAPVEPWPGAGPVPETTSGALGNAL